MPTHRIPLLFLLAGALGALPGAAQYQSHLLLAGGPSLPMGALNHDARTGWIGLAGFDIPMGARDFALRPEFFYSTYPRDNPPDIVDRTTVIGGYLSLVRYLRHGSLRPYVLAGAGFQHHHISYNLTTVPFRHDNQGGVLGGVGMSTGGRSVQWFVEARIVAAVLGGSTTFMPMLAGIRLRSGGRQ